MAPLFNSSIYPNYFLDISMYYLRFIKHVNILIRFGLNIYFCREVFWNVLSVFPVSEFFFYNFK